MKAAKTLLTVAAALFLLAGTAALTGTDALAQIRAALVRDVDEPARVPYEHVVTPTRPFGNAYIAEFPAVPAGKRLKLTKITGLIRFVDSANVGAFVSVNNPAPTADAPRLIVPLSQFGAAYYGQVYSFSIDVDYIFNAGEAPRVEVGVAAGTGGLPVPVAPAQAIRAHGYLVDLSL